MKINDYYSIELVLIETGADGTPGDCYRNYEWFRKEKPYASFRWGYCVLNANGFIPAACNDWNDTPDEAYADYLYNVEEATP